MTGATPGQPAEVACPAWCRRSHELRDARLICHSATVAERQIGNAVITVGVKSTVRVPDADVLRPHVALTLAEGGKRHQLDPTPSEALLLADLLEMTGGARWLVDALTEAAALITGQEPDGHVWQVAP